jgi:hypothetical protein
MQDYPQYLPGQNVEGAFYRALTGFRHESRTTASDVVKYEAEELGNTDIAQQAQEMGMDLSVWPAERLMWVSRTREAAARYGEPRQVEIPLGSKIVATTKEGDLLILAGPRE